MLPAMYFPPETSPVHAWYSAKQEAMRRKQPGDVPACVWYADADGKCVETTMVTAGPDHGCNEDALDDLVYLGIVVRYAGICRR